MRLLQASSYSMALHGSALVGLLALSVLVVGPLPEGVWHAPTEPLYLSLDPPDGGGDSARQASSRKPADRTVPGASSTLRRDATQAPQREPPPEAPPPSLPEQIPEPATALQNAAGDPNADSAEASGGASGDASTGDGNGTSGDGNGRWGDGTGTGTGTGNGAGVGPGGGDEVLYLDGTITLPVVVKRVEPVYPPPARLARLEATLRFQVVVDDHGDVIEVIPIKTHPLFEQSAVEALRRWKYRPATQGGRAVKVYLLVTVEFRLIG